MTEGGRDFSGLLYQLDPRVKLWFALLALIASFLTPDLRGLAAILLVSQIALMLGGVPFRQILGLWMALAPIMIIILILQPLFSPGGEVLGRVGPLSITEQGVSTGARYALRLGAAAFVVMVPIATTQTPALVRGLVKTGMPYTLGMTVGLALHYLETVGGLYTSISEAQQARGWDLSERRLIRRARAAIPTLIAVIIASLRLSDALAIGLAARGFGFGGPRTTYRDQRMTRLDWGVLLITTLVFAAVVIVMVARVD